MKSLPLAAAAQCLCALLAAAAPPLALSQSQRTPDPADAQARVAPLRHRSSLSSHRPTAQAAPTEPGDWRAANDRVHTLGGWRAYAKEAQAPAAPAAPASGARP